MIFRADQEENTAVVKMPDESYAGWALRASMTCDITPGDLVAAALDLADLARAEYAGEALSQLLIAVQQWA
jgi:hypothetical protein